MTEWNANSLITQGDGRASPQFVIWLSDVQDLAGGIKWNANSVMMTENRASPQFMLWIGDLETLVGGVPVQWNANSPISLGDGRASPPFLLWLNDVQDRAAP